MGTHVDSRGKSRKQKRFNEDADARRQRIGFKQYLRELEAQLEADTLNEGQLDNELDATDDDL